MITNIYKNLQRRRIRNNFAEFGSENRSKMTHLMKLMDDECMVNSDPACLESLRGEIIALAGDLDFAHKFRTNTYQLIP